MVVQHNLQAMNANRMLGITEKTVAGTTEKLSSGYKINRAADNAAGLAISEKMRKQIRGLSQASTNAEDGVSSVQTAEGALSEVQDMLQRMNELCVQAANGTNSKTDRQYIQDEIDQLVLEVDRVAETTKFNETYLLKGDKTNGTKSTYINDYYVTYTRNVVSNAVANASTYKIDYNGSNNVLVVSASIMTATSTALSAAKVQTGDDITPYFSDGAAAAGGDDATLGRIGYTSHFNTTSYVAFVNVELNSVVATSPNTPPTGLASTTDLYIDTGASGSTVRAARDLFIYNTDTGTVVHKYAGDAMTDFLDAADNTMNSKYRLVDTITYDAATYNAGGTKTYGDRAGTWDWSPSNLSLNESKQTLYDADGNEVSGVRLDDFFDKDGNYQGGLYRTKQATVDDEVAPASVNKYLQQMETKIANDLEFTLHVGSDSNLENKIITNITALTADGLGISKLDSKYIGIVDDTGLLATNAIDTVASAINMISRQRALLGAVQNRLEHTIKNLDNVVENTQSAESTIRDTDMATEMVAYSNANILQQAGQSMLAQSNQANQGVTQLLQ